MPKSKKELEFRLNTSFVSSTPRTFAGNVTTVEVGISIDPYPDSIWLEEVEAALKEYGEQGNYTRLKICICSLYLTCLSKDVPNLTEADLAAEKKLLRQLSEKATKKFFQRRVNEKKFSDKLESIEEGWNNA